jgi:hypothetical protein
MKLAFVLLCCTSAFASAHVLSHAANESPKKAVKQLAKVSSFPALHPKRTARGLGRAGSGTAKALLATGKFIF